MLKNMYLISIVSYMNIVTETLQFIHCLKQSNICFVLHKFIHTEFLLLLLLQNRISSKLIKVFILFYIFVPFISCFFLFIGVHIGFIEISRTKLDRKILCFLRHFNKLCQSEINCFCSSIYIRFEYINEPLNWRWD